MALSANPKRYTHFVERSDGKGDYRDYARLTTVLKRHGETVNTPGVTHSMVKDYGTDGEQDAVLADWRAA